MQAISIVTATEPRRWHAALLHPEQAPKSALRDALLGGDETQFELFVAQRYATLNRIASCACEPSEATALVQQALVDFCSELGSSETDVSMDVELFGCLLRRMRARAAELGAGDPFELDEPSAPAVASDRFRGADHRWGGGWLEAPKPFAVDAAAELPRVLATGLDRLPPALRVVAVLRDVHGLGCSEIGRLLSLPEPRVRERLHRARSRLRGELEAHVSHTEAHT